MYVESEVHFLRRKVTFYIDDEAYMRYHLRKYNNLSEAEIEEALSNYENFRIIYTLFGDGNFFDYYEIKSDDGCIYADWQFTDYQREFFTECMGYFVGQIDEPFGVTRIVEHYY